ncbi:MAG: hypothetical protein AAF589_08285, partial [Planctomycetota bacterium]
MSTKLKNAGKMKTLFLSHGEKLGVALVAGLAGWLIYASMGREVEERQPDALASLATQTSSRVNGFTWDDALQADPPPRTDDEFQAAADDDINPDLYAISRRGWDRAVVPPVVLRKDPVLLAPITAEGHGYTLLMPFYSDATAKKRALDERREEERREREREKERDRAAEDAGNPRGRRGGRRADPMLGVDGDPNRRRVNSAGRNVGVSLSGDELVEIKSCAVVLAKVPVSDQLKIYQDTFENALGYQPDRDLPQYLGYFV